VESRGHGRPRQFPGGEEMSVDEFLRRIDHLISLLETLIAAVED
jgi:hypothetical protein